MLWDACYAADIFSAPSLQLFVEDELFYVLIIWKTGSYKKSAFLYSQLWCPTVGCFTKTSISTNICYRFLLFSWTLKDKNNKMMSSLPPSLQVIVLGLSDERSDHLVDVSVVDLLQDREGFTWKGHDRLEPRLKPAPFPPGFQPLVLVQCLPPASVTAVALHAEWNLISFGTSHGFGLFDYHRRNAVLARLLFCLYIGNILSLLLLIFFLSCLVFPLFLIQESLNEIWKIFRFEKCNLSSQL